MDLLPDEAQATIVATTRDLLAGAAPTERLRGDGAAVPGRDPALWAGGARCEWFGGRGPLVDDALRARELGRFLVPGPYLATVLAARLAGRVGEQALQADIGAGRAVVALGQPLHATDAPGPTIAGRFQLLDGSGSTHVLVVGERSATVVERDALSEGDEDPCLDPLVELTTADAAGAQAVAHEVGGAPAAEAGALLAATAAGIAEATRDASSERARDREQFRRPIGAFQAVKHRCADMAILAEAAWCQSAFAAMCLDAAQPEAAFQAHAARVVAVDAATRNAEANIQNHGATACTVEHDAHLYLKRAQVLAQVGGTPRSHLAAVLDHRPRA